MSDKQIREELEAVKTELAAVEDRVFERLRSWIEEQIGTARQSMDRPQQAAAGPVDDQLVMINNARPSRGTPPAGPVRFGEVAPAFDGAVDRINNKRKELLGK